MSGSLCNRKNRTCINKKLSKRSQVRRNITKDSDLLGRK